MSEQDNLNGSVDLLAKAMRQVFTEAVKGATAPLETEMKALRTDVRDMESRLNDRIDTTDENMQAQFAQHRKDVSDDLKAALAEKGE